MSPRRVAGQARPPGVSLVARPLPVPHGTQRPGGAKRYHLNVAPQSLGGPGPVPSWFNASNFGGGTPAADEWPIYWACLRYFKGPPGQDWLYQTKIAASLPGGIKPDFVIIRVTPNVVMRVQSERYHQAVPFNQAVYDLEQRIALERFGYRVIDLFPQYFIVDGSAERGYGYLTGQASIRAVIEAEQGRQRMNPRGTQTSFARA